MSMANQRELRLQSLVLSFVVSTFLTGCFNTLIHKSNDQEFESAQQRTRQVIQPIAKQPKTKGSAEYAEDQARIQQSPAVFKKANAQWVGSRYVPVNAQDRLPAEFHQNYVLRFNDTQGVPITTVAARLTELVGIPVRIESDVLQPDASASGSDRKAIAGSVAFAADQSPEQISMKWNGTLVDFLNHLTDRLGLSWEYKDNSIVLMRFVTASYELATFPNAYDYTLSSGAGGNTGSEGVSANSSLAVSEKGKMEGLKSILTVVGRLVASVPGSEVIQAEGSGRILVKTSKPMQAKVRELILAENAAMLKQVHIQLDIYSVSIDRSNQRGVDWSVFYQNVLGNPNTGGSPATLVDTTSGGTMAFRIDSKKFGGSSVVLRALNELGNNVQHRPISLIALNRQWSRKARISTQGYLSETTPGTGSVAGGIAGLPGLKTDAITTGDQFSAMPFVLENNTVLVKMGVSLSTLESLFDVTTGTGATLQRVQTPNTSQINDQLTVSLKPGEVMAITGLSRDIVASNNRSLGESLPWYLGGSSTATVMREHFVIFVRAILI